jgi:hypothetical protein
MSLRTPDNGVACDLRSNALLRSFSCVLPEAPTMETDGL